MRRATTRRRRVGAGRSRRPIRVAVVGGGLAGLTAAFRLAERGYTVTLYEKRPYVGGEFGAHSHDGGQTYHEHCYHMLLNWYHNFWRLTENVGLNRARIFERREAVHHLEVGQFPHTTRLVNPGAPPAMADNLFSGVKPPADMFLYMYSVLDLASQPFDSRLLRRYTVNAFLQSRPYASERSAQLHDDTLAKAFAIPSYLTAAAPYKNFVRFGLRQPDPMMWMLRGDCERRFNRAVVQALRRAGCDVRTSTEVTDLVVRHAAGLPRVVRIGAVSGPYIWDCRQVVPVRGRITLETYAAHAGPPAVLGEEEVDYVVLAIPQDALPRLLGSGGLDALRESVPRLTTLRTEPMASLDLVLKRRLRRMPKDPVMCVASELGLALFDTSQLWPELLDGRRTHLNLIAANFAALPHVNPDGSVAAILRELQAYLPFGLDAIHPGTHFQPNLGATLFINDVGSEDWRPDATTRIPNLFLAGDYCRTFIDVVSVEGAVVSGLNAAQAVQAGVKRDRGADAREAWLRPIEILEPATYPEAGLFALKLLLAPWAATAKAWSLLGEHMAHHGPRPPARRDWAARGRRPAPPAGFVHPSPGMLGAGGFRYLMAPAAMALDLWTSGWDMIRAWDR